MSCLGLIPTSISPGTFTFLPVLRDGEVLPGISAIPLPGHTDGHTGFRLESGKESLLVWGDIVHFPQIQIARPEVAIAFDQAPFFRRTHGRTAGHGERGAAAGIAYEA